MNLIGLVEKVGGYRNWIGGEVLNENDRFNFGGFSTHPTAEWFIYLLRWGGKAKGHPF